MVSSLQLCTTTMENVHFVLKRLHIIYICTLEQW